MLGDEHLLGEVVGEVDVEVGELFGGVLAGVLEGLEFGLGLDGGEEGRVVLGGGGDQDLDVGVGGRGGVRELVGLEEDGDLGGRRLREELGFGRLHIVIKNVIYIYKCNVKK